jgi:hypothetical protein
MTSETDRYEAFVRLSSAPHSQWVTAIKIMFRDDPDGCAEVLELLSATGDAEEIRLLPDGMSYAATTVFGLLVRLARGASAIPKS